MANYDRNFKNMLTSNLGLDSLLDKPQQSIGTPIVPAINPNNKDEIASLIGTGRLAAQNDNSIQQ